MNAEIELDLEMLDKLCQERKIQRQQKMRDEIDSKLAEIARSSNPPSKAVTRPYGVEREGEADDVWGHILERVIDPPEIKNLWNVSGMFRNTLRGKYIEARLSEIVRFVADKQYMPFEQRHGTFGTMRLVSRLCKRSVEEKFIASIVFMSAEKVRRTCEVLEEKPSIAASLFPLVTIIICEAEVQDGLELFREAIKEFFLLAGDKLRHIIYYSSLETSQDIYNCLCEWAALLPNLEYLMLGRQPHYPTGQNRDEGNDEGPVELEEIQPFPILPKLQYFEESGAASGVLSSPFIQRILQSCPGIEDLTFTEGHRVREHSLPVLANLSNLTCLQICPYRSLLRQQNLPWKLKTLILSREDLTMYTNEKTVKVAVSSYRLFSFLKQFEETLEHLELNMVDVCEGGGYLELRNLKTLKMELHESYDNLDFLLYAEKLEILKIRMGKEYMWELSPDEKFSRIVSGSFLGRSLWDVFPYLRQFFLRTCGGAKFEEHRKA